MLIPIAGAADGALDATFGSSGIGSLSVGTGEQVYGSFLQPDGKIIVHGGVSGTTEDTAVVRFNADGTVDTTFASGGKFIFEPIAGRTDRATCAGVQSDGKIIIGGYTRFASGNDNFYVLRLSSSGVLDTTYGTNGVTMIDFNGRTDRASALAVIAGDKVLITGSASDASGSSDFGIACLNANGTLDTTFGVNGKVTVNVGNQQDTPNSMAVQSDGKIILAGISASAGDTFKATMLRFTASGALDTSFGTGGIVAANLPGSTYDTIYTVRLQPDGKIVTSGFYNSTDASVARYTSTGQLDTSFNGVGFATVDFGSTSDQFFGLAIQSNGKIVAGGNYINGSYLDSVLVRLNSDGALDTGFATNGKKIISLEPTSDSIKGLWIDSAGQIVAPLQYGGDYGVARFTVTAPVVASINRQNPTSSDLSTSSATFRVTFSLTVTGVDASDFILTATGAANGTISSVSSVSGSVYDITVQSISGEGVLRLDLKSSGTGIQDAGGNAIAAGFTSGQTYTVVASNHAPTAIALSKQEVNQSAGVNAIVGAFSTTDADSADSHTYTLVTGAGAIHNGYFNISGTNLRANDTGNMDPGGYGIRVRVSDGNGGTYEKAFVVNINDDIAPTLISSSELTAVYQTPFTYVPVASPDLAYVSLLDAPNWMGVGEDTSIQGEPQASGVFTFQIVLHDWAGNESFTPATITVAKAPATVSLAGLFHTFDGSNKSAVASVSPAGLNMQLTYNGGFEFPVNAGSYTVSATVVDNNYSGSATGTLVIDKAAATVQLAGLDQIYDGSEKSVTASTIPANLPVIITYNGTVDKPTAAGPYAVVATVDDNNYAGEASGTFEIRKANAIVTLSGLSHVYDGSAKSAIAVTDPANLGVQFTYNGSADLPTNAGSYTVVGTIHERDYTGAATNTLVIVKAPATVTLAGLVHTFDGSSKSAVASVSPEGLNVQITYNGGSELPVNAGSYAVSATVVDSNYSGSATGTLVIGKAAATVQLAGLEQIFDGSEKSVTATTTPAELPVAITYNGSSDKPTAAGSYTVLATVEDANYAGEGSGTFEIRKANAIVTLSGLSHVYDGSAKSATAVTDPANLGVQFTYNGSADLPTNAGSYTVVGTIHERDYTGAATNTLVIVKAPATVTLAGLVHTFDGSSKSAVASVSPEGLNVQITYNGGSELPVNAGSYAASASVLDNNYSGSATGTLVIGKAAATVQLAGLDQIFDSSEKSVTATTTPAELPVVITYNGSSDKPTAAGSYTVLATVEDANYAGEGSGTFEIRKANAIVTLSGLSHVYDANSKKATAVTEPADLDVQFTYNGSADLPTNAGSYTVVAAIHNSNYAGAATNMLVIAKAPATVSLAGLVHTFDGSEKSITVSTTPAELPVIITYNGSSEKPTAAGSYTVLATIEHNNYAGEASGTLEIRQANATVTLSSLSHVYDGNGKSAMAVTEPADLNVQFTYDGGAELPTNAGSYTVVGTIHDSNYAGAATNILVIAKAPATVSLAGLVHTYDGSGKSAQASVRPEGLNVQLTYNGGSELPVNAGSYAVSATALDNNYSGSATGTLVIGKAAATVQLAGLEQIFNGSEKSVTASTTPADLPVVITYNGSSGKPTAVGSYTVLATVEHNNYSGEASGVLRIANGVQVQFASQEVIYTIGQAPVRLATNATLSANGPDALAAAKVAATLATNSDTLQIRLMIATNEVVTLNEENGSIQINGRGTASFSGGTNNMPLVVAFLPDTSATDAQEIVRSIAVSAERGSPSTSSVSLTFEAASMAQPASGEVTILVNNPPVARTYWSATIKDNSVTVELAALLGNCNDADGDVLEVSDRIDPQHGALTIDASSLTYTPTNGYTGLDTIRLKITDGRGGFAWQEWMIRVAGDQELVAIDVSHNRPDPEQQEIHLVSGGSPNQRYRVYASDDLVSWQLIGEAVSHDNGMLEYVDQPTGQTLHRFYRTEAIE